MTGARQSNVWDAIEPDPVKVEHLKFRFGAVKGGRLPPVRLPMRVGEHDTQPSGHLRRSPQKRPGRPDGAKVNRPPFSAGTGDVPHRPSSREGDNQEQGWDYKGGRLAHMKYQAFRNYLCLSLALLFVTLGALHVNAAAVPISGSYEVTQESALGSQVKVLVRFHLTNHGTGMLSLRRLLLSDFSHPPAGASLAQPIALPSGVTEDTSQEFSIPRLQLNQWKKGVLPRAVLELESSTGVRTTLAIRIEPVPVREGQ